MNDRFEEDLGEPIAELKLLDEEPDRSFLARIRGSVERRMFAGDVLDFTLLGVGQLFLEFVGMFMTLFSAASPPSEKEDR